MSRKKPRFTIGQQVVVSAVSTVGYDENKQRHVTAHPCKPFVGFIVGARRRMLGTYDPGYRGSNYYGEDDYEPPSLVVSGSVLVWLVAESMTNKHHEVQDGDISEADTQHWPPVVPWKLHSDPWPYDDDYRQMLKEEAQKMPRDTNGRFKKVRL